MPHSVTVEGAAVAVVELAADGAVAGWNADATRLFGWQPEQVVGRPFHQIVDPVAGQRPPAEAAPPNGVWQGVYTLLAGDGTPVPVFASHPAVGDGRSAALLLVPGSPADADRAPGRPHRHPRRYAASRTRSGCATTRCCGSPSTTTCRWRRSGSGTHSTPTRRTC